MAGSLHHVLHGWDLIENMGDAQEATEEMLWLIVRAIGEKKAMKLLDREFYPMVRGERPPDKAMLRVKECMEDTHDT